MRKGHILILDDDIGSVQPLAAFLKEAGFDVVCIDNGSKAMACLHDASPDVVLLELWLPGLDGIDVLQAIKSHGANTAVIMMSGHGSITAAMRTVQLGAFDFLEKPLEPEAVLDAIYRALHHMPSTTFPQPLRAPKQERTAATSSMRHAARRMPHAASQRTLRRSLVVRGHGLQGGDKTGLILSPLPPGSGIVFRDLVTGDSVPATVDYVASTAFCTNLHKGRVRVNTIEHLMSVLHAFGLTNLLITVSHEVPIMDGSAADLCRLIADAGIAEQEAVAESYTVERCYHLGGNSLQSKFIRLDPYDGFRVTYRASYPEPIGLQEWTYEHRDSASYCCEVAPARTFAFIRDVEAMHAAGLVAGGRLNNVILIGDRNIVNTTPLRFANEWVRHKVLDIIGDLYLLGMPIRGHVRANMTGHTENIEIVRHVRQAMDAV
jgi:UDP-3-O-acyl N-acetylglucosamine deacetylase